VDLGIAEAAAVVTGGSKGMGRAVADILAADGARVAVMARGRDALDETVTALTASGSPDAVGISVDMTDPASIDAGFRQVQDRWGELNILVHTIGPGAARFEDLDDSGWDAAFDLGMMSAVRSVRSALPMLRGADWGRVVIFSAHSIKRQSPNLVAYTASKAAVTSIAKNLAKSLAPDGILVNAVCPGSIVTASFTEGLREIFAAENLDPADPYDVMTWIDRTFHHPADLGRAGLPDEVASLVAYLASRRNGYVTGACVNADGGSDFV
jgi:NAD(P)-dependent dehydrogenase (short-subunit alcohol dehydrogenase family)